jgi:hypothetical protein
MHNGLADACERPATRILVLDDYGNPAVLTVHISWGHIGTWRAGDPEFQEKLREYGIHKTVVVKKFDPSTTDGALSSSLQQLTDRRFSQ